MHRPERRRLVIDHEGRRKVFDIVRDRTVIGRGEDADLTLRNERVSRRHCEIRRVGRLLLVEDLDSANGTRVNGEPVRVQELRRGDRVRIGGVTLHVDEVAEPPAAAGAARPPAGADRPSPRRRHVVGPLAAVAGAVLVGAIVVATLGGGDDPATATGGPDAPVAHAPDPAAAEPGETPGTGAAEASEPEPSELARGRLQRLLAARRWKPAVRLVERHGRPPELVRTLELAVDLELVRLRERVAALLQSEGEVRALAELYAAANRYPVALEVPRRIPAIAEELGLEARAPEGGGATVAHEEPAGGEDGPRPAVPAAAGSEQPPAPAAVDETRLGGLLETAEGHLARRDLEQARPLFEAVQRAAAGARSHALLARSERGLRRVGAWERLFSALGAAAPERVGDVGRIPYMAGRSGRLLSADAEGIVVAGPDGPQTLGWRVVPAATILRLLRPLQLDPARTVDAASAMLQSGRVEDGAALLVRAFRADPGLKPTIDQVLADHRRTAVPPGGFTLFKGAWHAPRELARSRLNATIREAREDLRAGAADDRRLAFDTLKDLGDAARSALHRGLLRARAEALEKIRRHGSYGKLARLARLRERLEELREGALELIFDRQRYPYPYRPARGASPEAFAAYKETQPVITERTRALADVWDDRKEIPVGRAFRDLVERLVWVQGRLEEAGFARTTPDDEWLLHLPAEASALSVRDMALSAADRERIDASRGVMAANEREFGVASRGEREQCRVTNEYRLMFGRWALRLHDPLVLASRHHCEDMVRLGFFSHTSPVEGKETPYKRAVAEGARPLGLSENIAMAGGAASAHSRWILSPGHHRNILGDPWRIMGPGNAGSRWCQLFSSGDRGDRQGKEDGGRRPR